MNGIQNGQGTISAPAAASTPFIASALLPDHFGVNVFCLEGFDPASVPVRATEGIGMTVVSAEARPEWPGPRE